MSSYRASKDRPEHPVSLPSGRGGRVSCEDGADRVKLLTQKRILEDPQTSLASSARRFILDLSEGAPYTFDISRNGVHVLLAGVRGHVALFHWTEARLACEMQLGVMLTSAAILHNETMFAVAERTAISIFDKNGMELHRLNRHAGVYAMSYLPYHFLLATIGKYGVLRYQDVSTGAFVAERKTMLGHVNVMDVTEGGVVVLGHLNGTVTLWAPSLNRFLVKAICHVGAVIALAVDRCTGRLYTAGADQTVSVWDLKQRVRHIERRLYRTPISAIAVSRTGMLAVALASQRQIEIYGHAPSDGVGPEQPALKRFSDVADQDNPTLHCLQIIDLPRGPAQRICKIAFVPFEDVLAVGHATGFSTYIVIGAGDPNIDTYEENPYETVVQRRESTVASLLNKVQPDAIMLDPAVIGSYGHFNEDEKLEIRDHIRRAHGDKTMYQGPATKLSRNAKREVHDAQVRESKHRRLKDASEAGRVEDHCQDDDAPDEVVDALARFER